MNTNDQSSSTSQSQSKLQQSKVIKLLQPIICNDPRFRAGRKLVQRNNFHTATNFFSLLLSRAEEEFGNSSLEAAAAGYEFGYALFLDESQLNLRDGGGRDDNDNDDGIGIDGIDDIGDSNGNESSRLSKRDVQVENALEYMVKACTILYEFINRLKCNDNDNGNGNGNVNGNDNYGDEKIMSSLSTSASGEKVRSASYSNSYYPWALEQLARALVGIGYVLSYQKKYPDALSSYLNAIPYREEMLKTAVEQLQKSTSQSLSLEIIKARRLLVEAYILIVEEILKCTPGKDIVTNTMESSSPSSNEDGDEDEDGDEQEQESSQLLLIPSQQRVEMAKTYYERAREELQEVIILMSKLDSQGNSSEKENVCHLATMVMEAGISLSTVAE